MKKIIQMVYNLFCFFLIIVGLTSMRKNDETIEIMHEGCDLNLCLEVINNLPPFGLKLTVTNNLKRTIALPTYCYKIFDDYWNVTTNCFFYIENEKGLSPKYCGILSKPAIGQAKLSDCLILKPNEEYVINIPNLINSYYVSESEYFEYEKLKISYIGFLGESNQVIIEKDNNFKKQDIKWGRVL